MQYKHIKSTVPLLTLCQIFLSALCLASGLEGAQGHKGNKRRQEHSAAATAQACKIHRRVNGILKHGLLKFNQILPGMFF